MHILVYTYKNVVGLYFGLKMNFMRLNKKRRYKTRWQNKTRRDKTRDVRVETRQKENQIRWEKTRCEYTVKGLRQDKINMIIEEKNKKYREEISSDETQRQDEDRWDEKNNKWEPDEMRWDFKKLKEN